MKKGIVMALAFVLTGCAGVELKEKKRPDSIEVISGLDVSFIQFIEPVNIIQILNDKDEMIFAVTRGGGIIVGPGYSPSDAALRFFEAFRRVWVNEIEKHCKAEKK